MSRGEIDIGAFNPIDFDRLTIPVKGEVKETVEGQMKKTLSTAQKYADRNPVTIKVITGQPVKATKGMAPLKNAIQKQAEATIDELNAEFEKATKKLAQETKAQMRSGTRKRKTKSNVATPAEDYDDYQLRSYEESIKANEKERKAIEARIKNIVGKYTSSAKSGNIDSIYKDAVSAYHKMEDAVTSGNATEELTKASDAVQKLASAISALTHVDPAKFFAELYTDLNTYAEETSKASSAAKDGIKKVIDEQIKTGSEAIDAAKTPFQRKWAQLVQNMIGGDAFANASNSEKGKAAKAIEGYLDEINSAFLNGTLESGKYQNKYLQRYINFLNSTKESAEQARHAKVGDPDIDSLFNPGGTTTYTHENVEALHAEAAAYDEVIRKAKERYGIVSKPPENTTVSESAQTNGLKDAVDNVTDAVKKKTNAFVDERDTVKKVVNDEKNYLEQLKKAINNITNPTKGTSESGENLQNALVSIKDTLDKLDAIPADSLQNGSDLSELLNGLKISKTTTTNLSELAVAIEFVSDALKGMDDTAIANMKGLDELVGKLEGLKGLTDILQNPEKFTKFVDDAKKKDAPSDDSEKSKFPKSKQTSIENAIARINNKIKDLNKDLFIPEGQTIFEDAKEQLKELEAELNSTGDINEFNTAANGLFDDLLKGKYNISNKHGTAILGLGDIKDASDASNAVSNLVNNYKNAKKIFEKPLDDNTGLASWKYQITDVDGTLKTLTFTFDESAGTIRQKVNKVTEAMSPMSEFADKVKKKWKDMAAYLLSFASFYQIVDVFKQGVQYVRELDTALTEFQVVTGSTKASLDAMKESARQTAHEVGTTSSQILASATDWSRLGYSAKEALDLSESAAKYATVGFTDVNSATKSLVSSLQAYYGDADDVAQKADEVVDKFVAVGNNLPITSAEIGQGIENAGAVLKVAGNDINETIGMLSAANSTMQDISTASSSLRVLSMRLRGTSASELEKAGEDTEGLIEDASKLYDTIKNLTKTDNFEGVSILTDTGAYKSTYEILLGIANVWGQLTDDKKSALLEAIAGKTRAAAAATILEHPELLQKGYETAANSMGASAQAMDIAMGQIDKKLAQLSENWQEFWQNTISSDFVKGIVDAGNALLGFTNKIGGLNTALGITAGILSAKVNVGRENYISYLV